MYLRDCNNQINNKDGCIYYYQGKDWIFDQYNPHKGNFNYRL